MSELKLSQMATDEQRRKVAEADSSGSTSASEACWPLSRFTARSVGRISSVLGELVPGA